MLAFLSFAMVCYRQWSHQISRMSPRSTDDRVGGRNVQSAQRYTSASQAGNVEKIIAACLIKMGEVAFSNAYDEGQRMSMGQAVTLALDEN
jgi:hypothetical protein